MITSSALLFFLSNFQEPVVANYCCVKLVVAYYCLVKSLGTSRTPPLLAPLDITWRPRPKVISNHFWWTLLTSTMRVTGYKSYGRLPHHHLLISFSSSPVMSRLPSIQSLHAYRHSSAGTGYGCLLLVVYLLTIKTGLVLPACRFRFLLAPVSLTLGCVTPAFGTWTGCFPPENKYLVFARLGTNVDIIL